MPNILFVCTANICRSPVAEALLRDRLEKRGLQNWTIHSAGTWAEHVRGASHHSITVMAKQGININQHQARMIQAGHLKEADLVLCLAMGHKEALNAEFPQYADKVYLLTEMINKRYSISDPYGQALSEYQRMADEVAKIIDLGLDRIIELAQGNGVS